MKNVIPTDPWDKIERDNPKPKPKIASGLRSLRASEQGNQPPINADEC